MAMGVGGGGGYNSDINVTPLVDVLLVLLIIFMVITPIAQMGYDIEIPKETKDIIVQPQESKQVILAVNSQNCQISQPLMGQPLPTTCTVLLNNTPTTLTDLPAKITELFKNRRGGDKILFLAAEEGLNYEGVIQVVDIAKQGVEDLSIGIVTDEALARGAAPGATPAEAPPL